MKPGDRFGGYTIERPLAHGGMADVFVARREGSAGFGRRVCLKRVREEHCADRAFAAMFVDEARIGSELRHGNIVAVDDFGEVAGSYFLAMAFVDGWDLATLSRTWLQAGLQFPIDVAVYITVEVARALDYAHRKCASDGTPLRIVHRDVSPQNVLVSRGGEVKLTDFGIAKVHAWLGHTAHDARTVKGKLAYMAPEQARGDVLDGRADVFALGVVLYELLAGCRPFRGSNSNELGYNILNSIRDELAAHRPDVSSRLEQIVDRMLSTDRERRFASAEAVVQQLMAIPEGLRGQSALARMLENPIFARDDSESPAATLEREVPADVDAIDATLAVASDKTAISSSSWAAEDRPNDTRVDPRSLDPARPDAAPRTSQPLVQTRTSSPTLADPGFAPGSRRPANDTSAEPRSAHPSRDRPTYEHSDPEAATRTHAAVPGSSMSGRAHPDAVPQTRRESQRTGKIALVAGLIAFIVVGAAIFLLLRWTDRASRRAIGRAGPDRPAAVAVSD